MTHEFTKKYMKFSAVVIGFGGPIFTLATREKHADLAQWFLGLLAGKANFHDFSHPTTPFLSALPGGFLFGWGVTVYALSGRAFDADPVGVQRAVVAGLSSWFVLDSLGSILSGNPVNVAWNVAVLGIAVGPMWLAYSHQESPKMK